MRIISGKLGGRKLSPPADPGLRPSSDRLRSGLFSMLSTIRSFDDLSVCDLYAGSGALGIETLSRGARGCTFVEKNKKTAECLKDTLKLFGVADQSTVLTGALPEKLAALPEAHFDLVLADPPYDLELSGFLPLVPKLLAPAGLFVLESRSGPAPTVSGSLKLLRERIYGDSVVRVYLFE